MKYFILFLITINLFAATTSDKKFSFDSDTGQLLVTGSSVSQADSLNVIQEGSKAFGSVTASYTTILALGTSRTYSHILISNTLNQDVKIRFGGSSEIILPAQESRTLDNFIMNGNIEIKHNGVAATAGIVYINAW